MKYGVFQLAKFYVFNSLCVNMCKYIWTFHESWNFCFEKWFQSLVTSQLCQSLVTCIGIRSGRGRLHRYFRSEIFFDCLNCLLRLGNIGRVIFLQGLLILLVCCRTAMIRIPGLIPHVFIENSRDPLPNFVKSRQKLAQKIIDLIFRRVKF